MTHESLLARPFSIDADQLRRETAVVILPPLGGQIPASKNDLMKHQVGRLARLKARIANQTFLAYRLLQLRLLSQRKLKILFSIKQGWQQSISKGFRFTPHKITFGELSPGSIQGHDLIVPLTIRDLMYLNSERQLIADNPIPIPSLKSILLCDDKCALNQALIENGFADYIPVMGTALEYPYILKMRVGEWGENSQIVGDKQQERAISAIRFDPAYFTQNFIPGPCQYSAHILFKNQRIACALSIKHVFETETPIQGLDRASYSRVCGCPYLDLFSSILVSLGFEGLCCIDYKVYRNRPYILEINPRFGGSLGRFFFSFLRFVE
jgi:hypothetical protein